MEVKFYWADGRGEGRISEADKRRLLEAHWLDAADFLKDVLADAQALYDEVLEKHNGL